MSKQYDKQFKEDAVKHYLEHRELGLKKCAGNLAVSKTACNTVRMHSHCGCQSPREYEEESLDKMESVIKKWTEVSFD